MAVRSDLKLETIDEILARERKVSSANFNPGSTKFLLRIPPGERTKPVLDLLIRQNQRLAFKVAIQEWHKYSRYIGGIIDQEDLESVATIGLIKAINKFDSAYNTEFSTYAVHWIRQAVRREIDDCMGIVRIPVHRISKITQILRNEAAFSIQAVKTAKLQEHRFLHRESLDQPTGDGDSDLFATISNRSLDVQKSEPSYDIPGAALLYNELNQRLIFEISKEKSSRNYKVVVARYGLGSEKSPKTLEEVGSAYGLTRERVRQICQRTVDRIAAARRFDEHDFEDC